MEATLSSNLYVHEDSLLVEHTMIVTTFLHYCIHTDPPSSPRNITSSIDSTSLTVTWSASSSAQNYTIALSPPVQSGESTFHTTSTSLTLEVLSGVEYTVRIFATNCIGNSHTTTHSVTGKE